MMHLLSVELNYNISAISAISDNFLSYKCFNCSLRSSFIIFASFSAFLLHGGTQITLLFWMPSPDDEHLLYLFAALWGAGDAIVQTQINGMVIAKRDK